MDDKQKTLLSNTISSLAKVIDFDKISKCLKSQGLITDCQMAKVSKDSYSILLKKYKLINTLIECKTPDAFKIFIDILKSLENWEALEILGYKPDRDFKFKQSKINDELAKITIANSTNPKYSLGMSSGSYESPKLHDSSNLTWTPPTSDNKLHNTPQHSSPLIKSTDLNEATSSESKTDINSYGQKNPHVSDIFTETNNIYRSGVKSRAGPLPALSGNCQRGQEAQRQKQSTSTQSNLLVAGGNTRQQGSGSNTCAVRSTLDKSQEVQRKILMLISGETGDFEGSNDSYINASVKNNERHNTYKPTTSDRSVQQDSVSDIHTHEEPVVSFHPYEQLMDNDQTSTTNSIADSAKHLCYSTSAFESDASSVESVMSYIDPNLHVTTELSNYPDILKTMEVRKATELRYNCEDDYKMTAKPRGPCLIVNNVDFEGDIFPTRKGSDNDATRFDTIFQQLGFQITYKRNLTADQMRSSFKDVAASCCAEHDSVFVFILSHGSEHGIYGTDGLEVNLETEILTCFDNKNCEIMRGKPKVFVIQACRGMLKDCGVVPRGLNGDEDATDSKLVWPSQLTPSQPGKGGAPPSLEPLHQHQGSQINRVPTTLLPSLKSNLNQRERKPIRTDMLIVFSCLAGYVSIRNETAGSWLGVALAYFIITNSYDRDLIRILNLVTSDVIQRESSHGHFQSIELKLLGWTKNLYLNPGQYQ